MMIYQHLESQPEKGKTSTFNAQAKLKCLLRYKIFFPPVQHEPWCVAPAEEPAPGLRHPGSLSSAPGSHWTDRTGSPSHRHLQTLPDTLGHAQQGLLWLCPAPSPQFPLAPLGRNTTGDIRRGKKQNDSWDVYIKQTDSQKCRLCCHFDHNSSCCPPTGHPPLCKLESHGPMISQTGQLKA